MHPAPSVIVFTVLSGAGYGALVVYALALMRGVQAPALLLTGTALVTVGLISSTLHLGHPKRAWRAVTQWRSSWLSREGIAALATYVPIALSLAQHYGLIAMDSRALAIALFAGAAITVFATAMIYASLRSIRHWHDRRVPPIYLTLALASGALLATWIAPMTIDPFAVVACLALAWLLKGWYWAKPPPGSGSTRATATGLSGDIRPFDPPHTESNYLRNEMGFRLARKHARRLKMLALVAGFVLPAVALSWLTVAATPAPLVTGLAFASGIGAVFVERWLFFAEAEHTVMLYY